MDETNDPGASANFKNAGSSFGAERTPFGLGESPSELGELRKEAVAGENARVLTLSGVLTDVTRKS